MGDRVDLNRPTLGLDALRAQSQLCKLFLGIANMGNNRIFAGIDLTQRCAATSAAGEKHAKNLFLRKFERKS